MPALIVWPMSMRETPKPVSIGSLVLKTRSVSGLIFRWMIGITPERVGLWSSPTAFIAAIANAMRSATFQSGSSWRWRTGLARVSIRVK